VDFAGPTTATYVAVGAGSPEGIHAELRDGRTVTTDLAAAHRYISVRGDQSSEVMRAQLLIDDPRLSALTLFDTPGTGNTNSVYGGLILDALDEATALVFVCPAGSKISTAERDFLAKAGRRIDRIVFVLTKIDEHPQWRESLRENEETVRADESRFPDDRFADIVFLPVSAQKSLNPRLRKRSGIDELWAQLQGIADTHIHLTQLNELRTVKSTLRDTFGLVGQRLKAMNEAETGNEAAIIDEQVRALAEQDKAWRSALTLEVQQARAAVQALQQMRIMQLRTDYQTRLAEATPEVIAESEARLVADLCAMQLRAHKDVREHTAEIARRFLAGIPDTDTAIEMVESQLPDPEKSLSSYLSERPPTPTNPMDKFTNIQTTFMGYSMSSGAAGIALAAVGITGGGALLAAAAIGLPGAAAWRYWTKRVRATAAEASHTHSWARDSIASASTIIDGQINTAFANSTRRLQEAFEMTFLDAKKQLVEMKQTYARGRKSVEAEKKRLERLQDRLVLLGRLCDRQRSSLLAPQATAATAPSS
jgi:hypothetical protein